MTRQHREIPKQKRRRVHFTEAQKIAAVTTARAIGQDHPLGAPSLSAVRELLGVDIAPTTIEDWLVAYPNVGLQVINPSEIVAQTQARIANKLQEVRDRALDRTLERLPNAEARDAMVIVGIASDKLEKMSAIPADLIALILEHIELAPRCNADLKQCYEDLSATFRTLIPQPINTDQLVQAQRIVNVTPSPPNK